MVIKMVNKSHFNQGHIGMNMLRKHGKKHTSNIDFSIPEKTYHGFFIQDSIDFLKTLPDSTIQLILIDPPYNLDLAKWDTFCNYMEWAKEWLSEVNRILTEKGNFVIFGGYQYQNGKKGDLLEIMHHLRHNSTLLFVNLIVWYYKNGMGAQRFFSNRHEEILWYAKSKRYYFDLDSVRIPFDENTKKAYKRDKRLNPESIEKGKNPTNVWEIGRLQGNSTERVGHPTQKPLEIIRRLVKSLSYPGSIVLDFFAGSGTTGRVCIEEKRNSILVDNSNTSLEFFNKHLENMKIGKSPNKYDLSINPTLKTFYKNIGIKNILH
jgi:site-specific DNA-methyltransferase (adenine-specific)